MLLFIVQCVTYGKIRVGEGKTYVAVCATRLCETHRHTAFKRHSCYDIRHEWSKLESLLFRR